MKSSAKTLPLRRVLIGAFPLVFAGILFVASVPLRATKELSLALKRNDYQAIRDLVGRANNVNVTSPKGNTALLMALEHDDIPTMRVLLDRGANVDHDNAPCLNGACMGPGETPLMIAVQRSNVEAVKILLAHGANTESIEGHGFTALVFARSPIYSLSLTPRNQPLIRRSELIVHLLKQAGAKG
jgi:ankyrin repeat protein